MMPPSSRPVLVGLALAACTAWTAPSALSLARGGWKSAVASVSVTPDTMPLAVGDVGKAQCFPRNAAGTLLTKTCAWTALDSTVAKASTGSATSSVTALKPGQTTVRVTVSGTTVDTSLWVTVSGTVPPPPPSGCTGVAVAAGASLQAAVNANPTGTTFCLAPGPYAGQTVQPKASDQLIGALDSLGGRLSILDGQNTVPYAVSGTAANVVLRNLIVQRYATPFNAGAAIWGQGATGWQILNVEARTNAWAGIYVSANSLIRHAYAHHNGWLGIVGDHVGGAVVDTSEVSYNNQAGNDPNCCAGGIKAIATSNLTLRGNFVHHNVGVGLWCDNCNATTYYLGNRVEDNTFAGIYQEVSADAVIDGNTVLRNGASNRGGIWVDNASNVEVKNNTVTGPTPNGLILLRELTRTDLPTRHLTNVWVHDNTVTMGATEFTGGVQYVGDNTYFTGKNNRFTSNHYHTTAGSPFRWLGLNKTWAQWQAAGQDLAGSYGP